MTAAATPTRFSLQTRVATILVVSLLGAAIVFYAILVLTTRRWFEHDLEARTRGTVVEIAEEIAVPLALGDDEGLRVIVSRELQDQDVAGVAILRGDGSRAVMDFKGADPWTRSMLAAPSPSAGGEAPSLTGRAGGIRVLVVTMEVTRPVAADAGGEMADLFGAAPDRGSQPGPGRLGWVRIATSTARFEPALAGIRRVALTVLAVAAALGLIVSLLLLRVGLRPLGEASALAREIASGHLDRRMPVQGADELGALAESMNTMAHALAVSRERERSEAAAMRDTAEAVVNIARGVRPAQDPIAVFQVVATELRRITRCEGAALAVPDDGGRCRLMQFDPAPGWGGLEPGVALDIAWYTELRESNGAAVRIAVSGRDEAISRTLARAGFATVLMVPLAASEEQPAALLLASHDPGAFTHSQRQAVTGLASHLASALHAAQLHQRLENAFDELRVTRDQLMRSERLTAAGEIASGIAHEFNNVLGAILGRLQLMRRRLRDGRLALEELEPAFAVMELAARDGAETVRRLRAFGQGDDTSDAEPIDLDDVVRQAVDLTRPRLRHDAEDAGAPIAVGVQSAPGALVLGHPAQLREVLANLILNAADALPQGGRIQLATRVDEGQVVVRVEDDGVGMAPEVQARVFDPFFTTKADGTGLGLSVAYSVVRQHGGRMAIESAPGRGTRIELHFPRASLEPVANDDQGAGPGGRSALPAGLSVLVVDDEPAVRALLLDIVRAIGHQPIGCESGQEAIEEHRRGHYDLVLTDLGMPGMSGWDLARAIRQGDPGVTIAFVTGWGDEIDPGAMRDAGADLVVSKPFSIEDLVRVTDIAARRRRLRAA